MKRKNRGIWEGKVEELQISKLLKTKLSESYSASEINNIKVDPQNEIVD